MTLKQATTEFRRAATSYERSGSDAARKRLKRALLKLLKAGGRITFTRAIEVAA
jgi:hypothetical protein